METSIQRETVMKQLRTDLAEARMVCSSLETLIHSLEHLEDKPENVQKVMVNICMWLVQTQGHPLEEVLLNLDDIFSKRH